VLLASALATVLVGATACAPTAGAVRTDAQLQVSCDVPEARVYVDEQFRGRASDLRGRAVGVVSGTRRVEVRADGWFTAYRDVPVAHKGRASVAIALQRVPDTEPAE
jgi:hypothetical protein